MAVLATLKKDRAGDWASLEGYLRELRHRRAGALGALASLLSAPAQEQRELAGHGTAGAVLLEVACDLRVPKGARLGAARCLLEAGIEAPFVGHLFVGAGDLVTDPRLGASARKLVEAGLPAALQLGGEAAQITLAAGAFARSVQAGASAVGRARIEELLAGAPDLHAGAIAGRFAIGAAELPEGQRTGWKRLLAQTCAAHRRAPDAAKRLGLAPAWPPVVPDAFAPMVREAEELAAAAAPDASKSRAPPLPPSAPPRDAAGTTQAAPGAAKTLGPPIRRSPFRRSIGTVVEVPAPPAPRTMEPVLARPSLSAEADARRPQAGSKAVGEPRAPAPAASGGGELRFDSRGKRIPRADRWNGDAFEWEAPVLPSPELPPPPRVAAAPGPFALRLRSVLDDLPEAVDRLCAAAEARASLAGERGLLRELTAELSREVWSGRTLPPDQAQRLRAVVADGAHPSPWRAAAAKVLEFFVPGRP